jgi:hypothetical protein
MKRVESNVKRWPGYVLLKDPLPLILKADYDDAFQDARKRAPKLNTTRAFAIMLPAIIPCVAEWHLENFPENVSPETFPGIGSDIDPVEPMNLLIRLMNSIVQMNRPPGNDADPNA